MFPAARPPPAVTVTAHGGPPTFRASCVKDAAPSLERYTAARFHRTPT